MRMRAHEELVTRMERSSTAGDGKPPRVAGENENESAHEPVLSLCTLQRR